MHRALACIVILVAMTHLVGAQTRSDAGSCAAYYRYQAQFFNNSVPSDKIMLGYFKVDVNAAPDDALKKLGQFFHECSSIFHNMSNEDYEYEHMSEWMSVDEREINRLLSNRQYNRDLAARESAARAQLTRQLADIPQCGENAVVQAVKGAVLNSPAGRTQGVELYDVDDIRDTSGIHLMGARECSANGAFNFGERRFSFSVKWFGTAKQRLIISLE